MKKALIIAFAALLVIAFAAPVMAETKVTFSGDYRVRGFYVNNAFGLADESGDEFKSSFFDQRFRFFAKFAPNDKVALNIAVNGLKDNKWGTQVSNLSWAGHAGSLGGPAGGQEYNSGLELFKAYLEINTAYGLFVVGRQTGQGTGGLTLLGYGGSPVGMDRLVLDSEHESDRVKYVYASGPLTLVGVYDKNVELDWATGDGYGDADNWAIVPIYKFANGGVGVVFAYVYDYTNPAVDSSFTVVNPGLQLNFGAFQLNGEAQWAFGTNQSNIDGVEDTDLTGSAYYIDGIYKYGPGEVGLLYAWFQGDDDLADDEIEGFASGSGADFVPLLLAYDIGVGNAVAAGPGNTNNHQIISAWWDHSVTEDLLLHAAWGWMSRLEVPDGWDESMGNEFDFGLSYNLMDNLNYTALFGYFMAGDYFKGGDDDAEVGNAYGFRHTLNMTF